jgi:hypothetical protein
MRITTTIFAILLSSVPGAAQVDVNYGGPPPSTEAKLFGEAAMLVRGRVEGKKIEPEPGPTTSVYNVRILELLKGGGQHSVGGVIDVHRHGGLDAKTADRDFAQFEVNDEVVLFLERGNNGWHWPLHGPEGSFKLTKDGRIHAYGKSGQVSKRQNGRSTIEFLAELRKNKN